MRRRAAIIATAAAAALGGGLLLAPNAQADPSICIDLVHCNDSKDECGSGRDRHENLTKGQIDPEAILHVVRVAGAPVICETADVGRKDDIAWLRTNL